MYTVTRDVPDVPSCPHQCFQELVTAFRQKKVGVGLVQE